MQTHRVFIAWMFLVCGLAGIISAQQMPQDYWYVERTWGSPGSGDGQFASIAGIVVATNGLVYVVDAGNNRIQVFQPDGTFVRKWGSSGSNAGQFNFAGPMSLGRCGLATGPDGLLYVFEAGNRRIQVFQLDGTFVRKWGSSGSAEGQFSLSYLPANPTSGQGLGIATDTNGFVYATDGGNNRIQVFQPDGTFVRTWGSSGSLIGQFNCPIGLVIDATGLIYVLDSGNRRIQVFQPDGVSVRTWGVQYPGVLAVGPDQLMYTDVGVYDRDGSSVRGAILASSHPHYDDDYALAFAPDGRAYGSINNNCTVSVLRRVYRNTASLPLTTTSIPVPAVLSAEQRPGTPYLDIDYRVDDSDATTLKVAALAFVDGGNTLSNLLRMNTLIEGTSTNVGNSVPANQVNRLTWNAAADWSTNFGQVKIEILAKDSRDLLKFHFIHIPSNGPNPELVIDRAPLLSDDLLSCWYWLLATNDPALSLATGKVVGVTAPYAGKVLAQGTTTTADGRAFLFQRMGVREASSAEVGRAKTAYTPGVTNQWNPRVTGDNRKNVNELGFDTYNYGTTAWFVVKP